MNKKVLIAIIVTVVVLALTCMFFLLYRKTNISQNAEQVIALVNEDEEEIVQEEEKIEKEIEIFKGNDRPIAIMIDNNVNAQPQSAISKAYIVYEIIVEGNETRLMPVFKDVPDDTVIGPIRSVRHYFIDYMNENDAICAHLGQSPQAESDIKIYKMDDINGQIYDTGKARTDVSLFWRVSHKKAPHNAYTSIGALKQIAKDKGFKLTSNERSVLKYTSQEIDLSKLDAFKVANHVVIPYASSHKVEYKYNEENKTYERYSKGKLQKDEITEEPLEIKNIIVTFVYNYTLNDGEGKGRQTLNNVGDALGFYITNGYARQIICRKDSRTAQTQYIDDFGNVIEINDGNTFINICPINAEVIFE